MLPLNETRSIVGTLCRSIKATCDRRVQLLQQAREEQFDEEDMEELMYNLDGKNELGCVWNVLGNELGLRTRGWWIVLSWDSFLAFERCSIDIQ